MILDNIRKLWGSDIDDKTYCKILSFIYFLYHDYYGIEQPRNVRDTLKILKSKYGI